MKKISKKVKVFVCLALILIVLLCYYFFVMSPVIITYSEAETRRIIEQAINLAVSNVINRTISYDSLIDINYNNNGEIQTMSANQYEINSITREIIKEAQIEMQTLGSNGLRLNIGTMTGIPFLIGRGPTISLRLVPIGAVSGDFVSEFDSVGINMTKHMLYLYITVHVSIVMPIKSYDVFSTNQVMLTESIIVGKVPEVYLNGGSLGEALDLVP